MKKYNSVLTILASILLIINIALLVLWLYNQQYTNKLESQIEEQNELIRNLYSNNFVLDKSRLDSICRNDTLSSTAELPRKISDSELRNIHNIMQHYADIIKNQDTERYADLFADSISRFFLQGMVSNRDVYNHIKWFWTSYPDSKTPEYNMSSISIDKNPFGYTVFLPSKKENAELVTELRLDKDLKIYYIRDYYAYIDKRKN